MLSSSNYQDYKIIAHCHICKKIDLCRLDCIDNHYKCTRHGGYIVDSE